MSVFAKCSDLLFDRSMVQATICYGPNGVPHGPDIIPCNAALVIETGGKQASMCCSMGGGAKSANGTCHSTGLCQNDDKFYRDFCIDSTFQSRNFLDPNNHGSLTDSVVYSCRSDTWRCGENLNGTNCCSNATAVFSLALTLVGQATAATVTTTVTETSSSSPRPQTQEGTTVGLGAALGVIFIGSLAGFFFLKRKWNRRDLPKYNKVEHNYHVRASQSYI